ncbi:Uncharacterised protein [Serratia plymuthica]|nr:Uncharacterised protein [Serratia plymuthica]
MMIYSSKEYAIADNYFNRINVFSFSTINSNFNARTPTAYCMVLLRTNYIYRSQRG